MDLLFDLIGSLALAAATLLDTKIRIPIISDILKDLGVDSFSFLDLITWIVAVAYTIPYKLINGKAPFPDTNEVQLLKSAANWTSFKAVAQPDSKTRTLNQATTTKDADGDIMMMMAAPPQASSLQSVDSLKAENPAPIEKTPQPLTWQEDLFPMPGPPSTRLSQDLFIAGHSIASLTAFVGCFVLVAEARDPMPEGKFSKPATAFKVATEAFAWAADQLCDKRPLREPAVQALSYATTSLGLLNAVAFSSTVQESLSPIGRLKWLKVVQPRQIESIIETILVIPALACTAWHCWELMNSKHDAACLSAICYEGGRVSQYLGRVAYCFAVRDPEELTRDALALVYGGSYAIVSGIEVDRAILQAINRKETD